MRVINKLPVELFLLVILLVISSKSYCQTTLYFGHDKNGNRIYRDTLIVNPQRIGEEIRKTDSLSTDGLTIKVYPNPTKSILNLEVSRKDFEDELFYFLYDMKGNLLIEKRILKSLVEINMDERIIGAYILTVKGKSFTNTWKIIKQ